MIDSDDARGPLTRGRAFAPAAANREPGTFVAAVPYDLRSPRRTIQGVTLVFTRPLDDGSSPGSRECIDCIRLSSGQLSRMLDRLMRISGGSAEAAPPASSGGRAAGVSAPPPREELAGAGAATLKEPPIAAADAANLDLALGNLRRRLGDEPANPASRPD